MAFSASKKAISGIRNQALQKDLAAIIASIEKATKGDRKMAASRTTRFIGLVFDLKNALPLATRRSIVNAAFDDAIKADVPHQWERNPGFECGPKLDCSKPNPETTCYRDTSLPVCYVL